MALLPGQCLLQDLGRVAEAQCMISSVATLGYLRVDSEVEIQMLSMALSPLGYYHLL